MLSYFFAKMLIPSLPYLAASILQILFLALPVYFKDWHDDLVNVVSYSAFQCLIASFLFLGVPAALGAEMLGHLGGSTVLGVVFLASWFRATRMIPLEGTSLFRKPVYHPPKVDFDEFYFSENFVELRRTNTQELGGVQKYRKLREELVRIKVERVGEELGR
jgi:hypothetical protein